MTRPAGRPARRAPAGTRRAPPRPCGGPGPAASARTASSAGAGRRRRARRTSAPGSPGGSRGRHGAVPARRYVDVGAAQSVMGRDCAYRGRAASIACQRARLYRASTRASCVPVGFGGSGGWPRSSQRWRSSRVKRGIGRAGRHRAPQLAQGDVVVGAEPRPQLDLLARSGQEGEQVLADPLPALPGLVGRRRQLVEHVAPHPRDRLVRVELGADGVELASRLVDDADGDEVDGRCPR